MAGFMTGAVALMFGAPIAIAAGGSVVAIQGVRTARNMFRIGTTHLSR